MFNFNSILSVVATLIMLISCSSIDATNEKPNNISYFHIVNTPAYITIDSEFNEADAIQDSNLCFDEGLRDGKFKSNILKGTGGFFGVGYLIVAADLATSGGVLSSIFVPFALGASAVGFVVYASSDRAEEYTAYSSAEACLEEMGYEVVFFLEE